MKKTGKFVMVGIFLLAYCFTALAGQWQQDLNVQTWRYQNEDGSYARGGWRQIDGLWYHFNLEGIMETGWYQDIDGTWYVLSGSGAMLSSCWHQDLASSKWYYLGQSGAMQTGGKTPDGYTLNADGSWNAENSQSTVKKISGGGSSGGGGGSSSGGGKSSSGSSSDGKTSSETTSEVGRIIQEFKNTYIKEEMSDFEKEMQIIQYMVENIKYDYDNYIAGTIPDISYTVEGALVKGIAVCDGYARAFVEMAKACGLEAEHITGGAGACYESDGLLGNGNHAWNKVKLDGKWYHVDVTWEDPVPENSYGFGNLRGTYINRTDAQMEGVHSWSEKSPLCNSEEYGVNSVRYYLYTGMAEKGIVADQVRKKLLENYHPDGKEEELLFHMGYQFDDKSNYFESLDEKKVYSYLLKMIEEGIHSVVLTGPMLEQDYLWNWTNEGDWYQMRIGLGTLFDYDAYIISYVGDGEDLLTGAEAEAYYQEKLLAAHSKEISEDSIYNYISELVKEKETKGTVICKGLNAYRDFSGFSLFNDETVEITDKKTVWVKGVAYTITDYAMKYQEKEEEEKRKGNEKTEDKTEEEEKLEKEIEESVGEGISVDVSIKVL
ncbi:MAG: hypothetical protein LBS02_14590 [Hungatella sp.]|jgi:hypothetical protein|nr:hypothetical protein [Hungatella sp.]